MGSRTETGAGAYIIKLYRSAENNHIKLVALVSSRHNHRCQLFYIRVLYCDVPYCIGARVCNQHVYLSIGTSYIYLSSPLKNKLEFLLCGLRATFDGTFESHIFWAVVVVQWLATVAHAYLGPIVKLIQTWL